MATNSLQVNRDIILATKQQHLQQRKQKTPIDAILSLAQMQQRPRGLLNYSHDSEKIIIIGQVKRHPVYDPVTSALHCRFNGADAISFFTDHSIYTNDLDDMLMVARALDYTPVLFQNYIMDEYEVMAARASNASALMVYTSLLPQKSVRQIVSMGQRWKMSTIVQIESADQLDYARSLSPHALSFGDHLVHNIEATVQQIKRISASLPPHYNLMMTHSLRELDQVELALQAPIDALIIDEMLLKNERSARLIRQMVDAAEAQRRIP